MNSIISFAIDMSPPAALRLMQAFVTKVVGNMYDKYFQNLGNA